MKNSEELYSSYIVNCVVDAFLSYTAIMLNSVTIHALRSYSSLPKPLKTLLLSLAVSDLGVGLLAQPFYIGLRVAELKLNTYINPTFTTTYLACLVTANLFFVASFLGVMALTADRFLAIHLHLRYQELVTHKRAVAVVISIWLLSTFLSLVRFCIPMEIIYVIFVIGGVACLIGATLFTIRIYLAVRGHLNQMQALQVQQVAANGEMANVSRMGKYGIVTIYVYLILFVCYLPRVCILLHRESRSSVFIKVLTRYTGTLMLLNSSLNPLIYCWKMGHIRHAVMDIMKNLKNMFRGDN